MLEIHIEEDHNEVLYHIYRQLGAKKLPLHDLTLVHLDSHPDLLIPRELQAQDVFHKQLLFSQLSIENWIIPAVFAGHFSRIIWIKPPWAHQIQTGEYNFVVGRHRESGLIRLSCTENYFLGELLYSDPEELLDPKPCVLHVMQLGNPDIQQLEASPAVTDGETECAGASNVLQTDEQISELDLASIDKVLSAVGQGAYVLDIDLDYFSTQDPFKEVYSEKQYGLLKQLYKFQLPKDKSKENISTCMSERTKQLADLKHIFTNLDEVDRKYIRQHERGDVIEELLADLALTDKDPVDFDWLHEVGTGIDDTELPHHVSTDGQITALMFVVMTLLQRLPTPRLVTIARSSQDDYCPQHQVDTIQTQILDVLGMYGEIFVSKHYLESDGWQF